jgi:hypothetical protein
MRKVVSVTSTEFDPGQEFDRQVQTLLDLKCPELARRTEDDFCGAVPALVPASAVALGRLPR